MSDQAELVLAQSQRFASIDPLLPALSGTALGEPLVVTLADGSRVAAVPHLTETEPGSVEALWSPRRTWELRPLIGAHGTEAMDAVLRTCAARLEPEPAHDSTWVVRWPSRDAEATRALLDHGFTAGCVLAVRARSGARPAPAAGVRVRASRPGELDTVARLELAEIAYSAHFGGLRRPPGKGDRRKLEQALRERLAARRPPLTWLAELDGEVVGAADGGHTDSHGAWPDTALPEGRWGYVYSVAVLPGARGRGVGQALMAVAHAELARAGIRGTYLAYNPVNPLSTVFWHRQGYRPLWTVWQKRPASSPH